VLLFLWLSQGGGVKKRSRERGEGKKRAVIHLDTIILSQSSSCIQEGLGKRDWGGKRGKKEKRGGHWLSVIIYIPFFSMSTAFSCREEEEEKEMGEKKEGREKREEKGGVATNSHP